MNKWIVLFLAAVGIYYFMNRPVNVKNMGNSNVTIVAFGDSLTEGYGVSPEKSYPAVLAGKLGKGVVNLGKSGETAVEGALRVPQVLTYSPYMVLIEFGANDFMRAMSTQDAIKAVGEIVDSVQRAGAIAVIVDTGAPGMGAYSKAYKKMARQKKAVFVPGIMTDIFNKKELKSDSVHPNAKGYEMVAEKIYKEIKPYMKKN